MIKASTTVNDIEMERKNLHRFFKLIRQGPIRYGEERKESR